jgi:hypothetical protein
VENYYVRLAPERVAALRALARKWSFVRGQDYTWVDCLRCGVDLVLEGEEGTPAVGASEQSNKETIVA